MAHPIIFRATTPSLMKYPVPGNLCPRQSCIGLEEVADGIWPIYFGRVLLARSDERDYILRD